MAEKCSRMEAAYQEEEEKLAGVEAAMTANEEKAEELNQEIIRILNEGAEIKAYSAV